MVHFGESVNPCSGRSLPKGCQMQDRKLTRDMVPVIKLARRLEYNYARIASYFQINQGRIGVMLVNLGTPDSTSTSDVRKYLREFLGDPRVIEVPRLIWFFILNLIILTFRPAKTAKAYE